jgi:hypothetical protein
MTEQVKRKTHMDYLNPKPHLRTSDILDQKITYTIKGHGLTKVYDKASREEVEKGIVYFRETPKYLIVNQTQMDQIAEVTGSVFLEDWIGKTITLVVESVKVGRGHEDAIRIKKPVVQSEPQKTNSTALREEWSIEFINEVIRQNVKIKTRENAVIWLNLVKPAKIEIIQELMAAYIDHRKIMTAEEAAKKVQEINQ